MTTLKSTAKALSEMPSPSWYPDQEQANKITDFILWFSRYEYALKREQQFSRTNYGYLEPNWLAFCAYLQQNHPQPPQALNETIAYLKAHPVQQLVNVGTWTPINCKSDWHWLIRSLTTVRNNLFHGSKQGTGKLLDSNRDQDLLKHCQGIMIKLLPLCPQSMQEAFN